MLIRCFFDRLHILEPASFHQGLWKTKRIPALLPFLLLLLCLCVHHKIRYGFLWEVLHPFFDVIHLSHSAVGWRSPRMSDRSLAIAKCRCVCRSCAVVLRSSFCVCRTGCNTCCRQSNRRIHDKIALQPVALAPLTLEEARRWGRAGFAGIGSLNRLRL
jgi:hypothetical protein